MVSKELYVKRYIKADVTERKDMLLEIEANAHLAFEEGNMELWKTWLEIEKEVHKIGYIYL